MEQLRTVLTPRGQLTYTLARKRVKNMNLRLDREGAVHLSVPARCPLDAADGWIISKCDWIFDHLQGREQAAQQPLLPEVDRRTCYLLLDESLERVLPLVVPLGVGRPALKLRTMRSQWGNCHWSQGYITLNTALARCPEALRDYVALHELVHFLHHDHGPGFYAVMDDLMPDWKERRRMLRSCSAALQS